MIRWRFYEPSPLRDMLELLAQQEGAHWREGGSQGAAMPINVHQTDSELVVTAALPGVRSDDVELSSQDGLITIRAHFEVQAGDYLHQEMRSLDYHRQVSLPGDVRFEEARAEFENGILVVHIPKRQAKAPEKIRIQVNRAGGSSTTLEAAKGEGYSEVDPNRAGPGSD